MNGGGAEDPERFLRGSRQLAGNQDRRRGRGPRAQPCVRGRADRTGMMGGSRILRMRVHRLRDADGANQRHGEYADHSHEDATICGRRYHTLFGVADSTPVCL